MTVNLTHAVAARSVHVREARRLGNREARYRETASPGGRPRTGLTPTAALPFRRDAPLPRRTTTPPSAHPNNTRASQNSSNSVSPLIS